MWNACSLTHPNACFQGTRALIYPLQHLLAAWYTTRLLVELMLTGPVLSHLVCLVFPFLCPAAVALMGLALVGAGPGQTRSDTSNTSMDSTDTATMHNNEEGHPAGTHSNPIPSSVLSKPGWTLPPQSPPQTGETATNSRPVKLQLIDLSHYSRMFFFPPPQSPPQTGKTATHSRPVKLQLIALSHISRMFSLTQNLSLQLSCAKRP